MKACKWMMEYGVAMALTFLFTVILGTRARRGDGL